ncbi:MAG: S8 family serine peptidase [Candidatus Magasanikbacteria bacterium]|nr:S8 family serine peptidase [Candidatus Magasanikbacteria bacterium]
MRYIFYLISILMLCAFPHSVLAKFSNDPHVEQWAYADTGMYEAWDYSTGSSNVIVAIIDNGFDTFHPDLDDNVWVNTDEISNNGIDDDANGYIDDVYGWNFWDGNNDPRPDVSTLGENEKKEGVYNHGTIVAGIIGAKGNNDRDGAGINWDVQLMNLKVLGNEGSGNLDGLADAIRYAVDNGAHVINISMVGSGNVQEINDAIEYARTREVIIVAAAGNTMSNLNMIPMYPICADAAFNYQNILGVSAIQESHRLAGFSNFGSTCIDITAPGVDIFSTVRFSPTNGLPDTYATKGWNGTSFAAPFVSGAAALVKSLQPTWSASKVFDTLLSTVHHTPSQDETAYANLFGSGLLQIDKAVQYAAQYNLPATPQANEKVPYEENSTSVPLEMIQSNTVIFVAPNTGEYEKHAYATQEELIQLRASFLNIDDISSSKKIGALMFYATLKQDTNGVVSVYIYDQDFRFINYWPIVQKGDFNIKLADLMGDTQFEIILTPRFSSDVYISVYSIEGVLLKTYAKKETHHGCVAEVVNGLHDQKDQLALLCVQNDESHIELLDSTLVPSQALVTVGIQGGELDLYDVDKDGVDEYIVAARAGKQQFVRIFDSAGIELSNFRAYPSQYKGGFDFLLSDYDGDGKTDFILAPHEDGMPVRALDFSGNYIESWYPFNSAQNGHVFILPN